MEDILASIRRILSEEEVAAQDSATSTAPRTSDTDDVLELDHSMMVAEPSPSRARESEPVAEAEPVSAASAAPPTHDAGHGTANNQPYSPPHPPLPAAAPPAADPSSSLVAPEAAAAAASSVGTLMRTLASERSATVHRGGPSIEDLVREELRPMLKQWLDVHLPPLVERLVRAEIERVASRAVA